MTIAALSDIILDVANAADPARAAQAKQRLAEAAGGDFAHLLDGVARPSASSSWSEIARARFFSDATGRAAGSGNSPDEARRGLETLIAKMLVETMLPKESEASFGKGTSGSVWRSMLADRLADDLTRGKGLGILKTSDLQRGTSA